MTEPTDTELDAVVCKHWPAFSMQATLVRMWVRAAMRDAIAKWDTPPAEQQAASSAVLKAIREANMQLVRTGDDAFMLVPYKRATAEQQAAPKAAPGEPDGFGSAEHWKEKAQYWAGVAHRLRGEALRGEPVDGIVHPPAPQQEAQEPCPSCRNSDIYACTCTFPTSRNAAPQPAPAPLSDDVVRDAAFEAVRKKLCALPRYSFVFAYNGLVRRVQDRTGNWIEFDKAHALFDPVSVDAALAAQGGKA